MSFCRMFCVFCVHDPADMITAFRFFCSASLNRSFSVNFVLFMFSRMIGSGGIFVMGVPLSVRYVRFGSVVRYFSPLFVMFVLLRTRSVRFFSVERYLNPSLVILVSLRYSSSSVVSGCSALISLLVMLLYPRCSTLSFCSVARCFSPLYVVFVLSRFSHVRFLYCVSIWRVLSFVVA